MKERNFLVINSGSSTERFALFRGSSKIAELHFEGDGAGKVMCTLTAKNQEQILPERWPNLDPALKVARRIFAKLTPEKLDAVLVRVVAAGEYFSKHHIVSERTFKALEQARLTNPLHVPKTLSDLRHAQSAFPETPIIAISDSAALMTPARRDFAYPLPESIIKQYDLGRWGAHGSSYGYIISQLKRESLILPKMVICHLGSGCSVTGLLDGSPAFTTMGETPLEGLLSSSRSGSIDPTIPALLGASLGAEAAIRLLTKESGLKALSGFDDLRQIAAGIKAGDEDCAKTMDLFVENIAGAVGSLAAKMGGIDALVFTGTIGVRSRSVRRGIIKLLGFMGFSVNGLAGADARLPYYDISSENSKPIYVIETDEAAYMVAAANRLLSTP